jgi:hypothetical protein
MLEYRISSLRRGIILFQYMLEYLLFLSIYVNPKYINVSKTYL